MPHDPYRALYVHVPFCVSRCGYCDFATEAIDSDDPYVGRYIDDTVREIRAKADEGELEAIESIYVGGGTPTHIGEANLSKLLEALAGSAASGRGVPEFTIEANPESLTPEIIDAAGAAGVNRISIGVQSFDDAILPSLGRAHDAARAREAVSAARSRFPNVSIDLMCGIPGQTNGSLEESIVEALELDVNHVSVYSLTIEPHTPFYHAAMAGRIVMPDEDAQAFHLELARDMLQAAGFTRYEVSNYAEPGFESRHNCSYWTGVPYLGIGTGATTMTQNASSRMRTCNGQVTDDLDERQMAAEDLMLGMRMACGISDAAAKKAGAIIPETPATLAKLAEDGLIAHEDGRWKPTERGWLCGNELYGRLLDLAP